MTGPDMADVAGAVPRLAVIITCWNYAEYVSLAIRSVLDQRCNDCELIVVDDGSTDASWSVIQEHGIRAYRIKNGGQRAACLYGLGKTRAPFVLFLDADDELQPGSLAIILEKLDDRVAKLQFPLVRIDRDGAVIGHPVPKLTAFRDRRALASRVLRTGTYTTPPTSGNVFRRDACRFLEEADYENAVDGVILFAVPFLGDVVSLSEPLGRYRVHDRNDSGLGRPLDAKLLRRELTRFMARMDHLRRILEPMAKAKNLARAEDTHFYLERSFYLAVAEGRRVPIANLARLLQRVWENDGSIKMRAALVGFLILTAMLPVRRAQQGLTYRLNTNQRSMAGLLRSLL
ncbi:Glycosyltransferase involved in cell wall bisynthesis [Rhizobium tibeticum]|uniref:GalNAc(5)-diNAcBac-PP-undecaprenol beta-1,3-glucosyltransferase n=1 Tax=Rhizobium tibeticum TaxID=501024 RepID=A0A1H8NRW9_9HYPH|nr:glycosyltransferase family 2 protein [Rhizobium tibeticum]SEI00668.1 GalNAc(5)-diNAcBac-PP-undecaprenol beta-1,3-glucosyltransferase [Rhizobium tibeticum]SEO32309.1 Glycosyltransferase involved in cell wall bisynthesis [Rhizobium tibeticum]